MIAPMEKITALVFHREREIFLSRLQELGVVHVAVEKKEEGAVALTERAQKITRAKELLRAAEKNDARRYRQYVAQPLPSPENFLWDEVFVLVESFEALQEELVKIGDRQEKVERELRNLAPWGDFDKESVRRLRAAGIGVRLFISPTAKFAACTQRGDLAWEEISRDQTYVYFVVFERGDPVQIDCDEFSLPDTDKKTLESDFQALREKQREKEKAREEIFANVRRVLAYVQAQETELAYLTVQEHLPTAAAGVVYVLTGWVPLSEKKAVEKFFEQEKLYYFFARPQVGEAVPILLKNNRYARLFEPIAKLFALPQYAELDLTVCFAPFFTLFFGLCLGDCGYGLVLLIAALAAAKKIPPALRPLAKLVAIFGVSTIAVGIVTGTFFGASFAQVAALQSVVLFDSNDMFNIALLVGMVQILFGMVVKCVNLSRQYGPAAALSTLGWILLVVGLSALAIPGMAKQPGPVWGSWLAYTGAGMILLFNDLKANIFVRLGKGLWELYGITGVFGDVLSYIRLFALGTSGAILGFVINEIALQCRQIPLVGYPVMVLLLIVGHTGNLLLGCLSSFVHPLRLTFVEFYKNAGFTGGGKPYAPFRKMTLSRQ
ncbi:MAG: hypothetical protein NC924_07995 [Candidatus Omnitrophica bacterium]|nr:hypothetical protein [Candidatus Omnitrophota bacterium]